MSNFRPSWASQLLSNWLVPHRAPELGAMALVNPAGPGEPPPPDPGEVVGGVVEPGGLVVEVGLVVGVGRLVEGGSGVVWKWGSRARRRNPSTERAEVATR